MNYESPVINGDGTNFRDFTDIDNVIQMNELAMINPNLLAINMGILLLLMIEPLYYK